MKLINFTKKVFQIKEDRAIRKILFFFFAGLLVRLLVMPFFTHPDLVHTYSKAVALVFEGRLYNTNFGFFWIFFHGILIKIFSFFTPAIKQGLLIKQNMDPFFNDFVSSDLAPRILFLFKLPFLILEMLSAVLSTRFVTKSKDKLALFAFWMLNPIMIFTLYVHGRSEIIAIFLLILAFLFFKKKLPALSFLALGWALVLRLFPIFFLPIFLKKTKGGLLKKAKYLLVSLSPITLDLVLMSFLRDESFSPLDKLNPVHKVFFSANLDVGLTQSASLLLAIWALFYLWFFLIEDSRGKGWQKIFNLSFWSLVPWFSLGFVHPQYFTWLIPFFAVFIGQTRKMAAAFFVFCLSWALVVLDYGRSLSWALFAPLNNFVFSNLTNVTTGFKMAWQQGSPNFSLTYLARSLMLGLFAFLFFFRTRLGRKKGFKNWLWLIVAPALMVGVVFSTQLFTHLELGFNIPRTAKDTEVEIKEVYGSVLSQTFESELDGLFKIMIYLYPFSPETRGDVNIRLIDQETEDVLAENFFRQTEMKNSQSINFQFKPIDGSLKRDFMVEISSSDHGSGQPLFFKLTDKDEYQEGYSLIDGIKRQQDLRMVLFYQLNQNLLALITDSIVSRVKGDSVFFTPYFSIVSFCFFVLVFLAGRSRLEKKKRLFS